MLDVRSILNAFKMSGQDRGWCSLQPSFTVCHVGVSLWDESAQHFLLLLKRKNKKNLISCFNWLGVLRILEKRYASIFPVA